MKKHEKFLADHIKYEKKYSTENGLQYELHCHDQYEINYILDGDVVFLMEGMEYRPPKNSVLLVAPHKFHGLYTLSDRPYIRYQIHFYEDLLKDEEEKLLLLPFSKDNVMFCNADNFHLDHYMEAIDDCQILDSWILDIAIRSRLISILAQLNAISASAISGEEIDPIAREVLTYINNHLTEPLYVEEIAKKFFMSKNYLTKIFRKMTGTTVANYILHKRLSIAKGLIQSGIPATSAALQSGFQEYSTFYRNYKKIFGRSPNEEEPK
ncbi:MAG: helix-turn-helix transcriptional regulator [Firmicutes bacterium]|uniref:Helix-turn-helix transcriptional regulator n=1 Tax=Candidatus Scybalomonas excrementavium TaxID=2840943 RepID=A0A9D9I1N3_9FIRM|nr:helix-turn-helix transcriptional regulator [Candidatus Scybalomonas excrementavium]